MNGDGEKLLERLDERTLALAEGLGRIERHTAETLGRIERQSGESAARIERSITMVAKEAREATAELWERVHAVDRRVNMMVGGLVVLQLLVTMVVASGWIGP